MCCEYPHLIETTCLSDDLRTFAVSPTCSWRDLTDNEKEVVYMSFRDRLYTSSAQCQEYEILLTELVNHIKPKAFKKIPKKFIFQLRRFIVKKRLQKAFKEVMTDGCV